MLCLLLLFILIAFVVAKQILTKTMIIITITIITIIILIMNHHLLHHQHDASNNTFPVFRSMPYVSTALPPTTVMCSLNLNDELNRKSAARGIGSIPSLSIWYKLPSRDGTSRFFRPPLLIYSHK